jgi:hypothetical protein
VNCLQSLNYGRERHVGRSERSIRSPNEEQAENADSCVLVLSYEEKMEERTF